MNQDTIPMNPYRRSGPIRESEEFFGRGRELRRLFQGVLKGENLDLIGDRLSGKTSLLFHMLHPPVQQRHLPQPDEFSFIFLDAKVLAPLSPARFNVAIVTELLRRFPETAQELDLNATDFEQLQALLEVLEPHRIVLLIDEFEQVTHCNQFSVDFFNVWRSLCGTKNITLVIATRQPVKDSCPSNLSSSPFFNLLTPQFLNPFSRADLEDFIHRTSQRSGVPLGSVADHIVSLAGFCPNTLQLACYHYFEAWLDRQAFDEQTHTIVRSHFMREAEWAYERFWQRIASPEDRALLHALADGENPPRKDLASLQQRGLVLEGQIVSSAFRDYIRRQSRPVSAIGPEPPQESAEPDPNKGVRVDAQSGHVYINGELLSEDLPAKEFKLVQLLHEHKGEICDNFQIVSAVWGGDYIEVVDDDRINALTYRLRKRLEPGGRPWKYVIRIFGRGLTLRDGSEEGDEVK